MKEAILALFPTTVEVTKEMIDKGRVNLYYTDLCTGALTLKKALGDTPYDRMGWGSLTGRIGIGDEIIIIDADREMMEVTEPCTVNLRVDEVCIR